MLSGRYLKKPSFSSGPMKQIRRLEPGNSVGIWIMAVDQVDLVAGGPNLTLTWVVLQKREKQNTGKTMASEIWLGEVCLFF